MPQRSVEPGCEVTGQLARFPALVGLGARHLDPGRSTPGASLQATLIFVDGVPLPSTWSGLSKEIKPKSACLPEKPRIVSSLNCLAARMSSHVFRERFQVSGPRLEASIGPR